MANKVSSVIIDLLHEEKNVSFMGGWVEESFVVKAIKSIYFSLKGVGKGQN